MFQMINLAEESDEEVMFTPERSRATERQSLRGMKIAGAAVLILGVVGLVFAFMVPPVVPGWKT